MMVSARLCFVLAALLAPAHRGTSVNDDRLRQRATVGSRRLLAARDRGFRGEQFAGVLKKKKGWSCLGKPDDPDELDDDELRRPRGGAFRPTRANAQESVDKLEGDVGSMGPRPVQPVPAFSRAHDPRSGLEKWREGIAAVAKATKSPLAASVDATKDLLDTLKAEDAAIHVERFDTSFEDVQRGIANADRPKAASYSLDADTVLRPSEHAQTLVRDAVCQKENGGGYRCDRSMRGFLAFVDLSKVAAKVSFKDRATHCRDRNLKSIDGSRYNRDGGAKDKFQTTRQFAEEQGLRLAINANFFLFAQNTVHDDEACGRVQGLSRSGGINQSGPEENIDAPDGMSQFSFGGNGKGMGTLLFDNQAGRGAIVHGLKDAQLGRGGEYASFSEGVAGNMLVEGGVLIPNERLNPDPTSRRARTAAGLRDHGRTLVIAMVESAPRDRTNVVHRDRANLAEQVEEGAQIRSPLKGASLLDMQRIMRHAGATDAINLDGGGSATAVYRTGGTDPFGPGRVLAASQPEDTSGADRRRRLTAYPHTYAYRDRHSTNHLGFKIKPAFAAEIAAARRRVTHALGASRLVLKAREARQAREAREAPKL